MSASALIAPAEISALYVTLRVPDPAALTAHATLVEMGDEHFGRLERGRVWLKAGGEDFGRTTETWLNPNKERSVPWEPLSGFGASQPREVWLLIRERQGEPEIRALRSFRERKALMPRELLTAAVWRVVVSGAGAALDRADLLAVVRSASAGLLVNPHAQVHDVCFPPGSLQEWHQRLAALKQEAL